MFLGINRTTIWHFTKYQGSGNSVVKCSSALIAGLWHSLFIYIVEYMDFVCERISCYRRTHLVSYCMGLVYTELYAATRTIP